MLLGMGMLGGLLKRMLRILLESMLRGLLESVMERPLLLLLLLLLGDGLRCCWVIVVRRCSLCRQSRFLQRHAPNIPRHSSQLSRIARYTLGGNPVGR